MKKHVFSLMMVLALVVLAGTSAWAQDGLTVTNAYWHLPGSTHGVQVANHTGATYAWTIEGSDCSGTGSGSVTGASIAAVSGAEYTATITYTADAAGVYLITCTESLGTCRTIRQFYTAVTNIDIEVEANASLGGDSLIAGELISCNDYYSLNSDSWLVGNDNADDNSNGLASWNGASGSWLNTRYVSAELKVSDLSGCTTPAINNAPSATGYGWQFAYAISGANYYDGTNNNWYEMVVSGGTSSDANSATGTITVPSGTNKVYIELHSYMRWAETNLEEIQTAVFRVNDATAVLDGSDADTDYDDGTEPATANGNNSITQTINPSPATPRITIND